MCMLRTYVAGTECNASWCTRSGHWFISVVAETVCKSGAHDATLKIAVIMSPEFKPVAGKKISSPQKNFFAICPSKKTVAATCPQLFAEVDFNL